MNSLLPTHLNFTSVQRKNEILQKVGTLRKQTMKHHKSESVMYYNDRLTEMNSELSFMARCFHRNKKITATWIK